MTGMPASWLCTAVRDSHEQAGSFDSGETGDRSSEDERGRDRGPEGNLARQHERLDRRAQQNRAAEVPPHRPAERDGALCGRDLDRRAQGNAARRLEDEDRRAQGNAARRGDELDRRSEWNGAGNRRGQRSEKRDDARVPPIRRRTECFSGAFRRTTRVWVLVSLPRPLIGALSGTVLLSVFLTRALSGTVRSMLGRLIGALSGTARPVGLRSATESG